jgi:arylsulfatase A-like enzyme
VRYHPLLILLAGCWSDPATQATRPNIVFIYADDLGYGDVSAYGATTIHTPNLDRLAAEGLRFTDAHAPAATCTPSRFALLTGQYAWRRRDARVLPGNAPLLIKPGRTTLPSLLKQAGYATGVIGKWHLGLGPAAGQDWNGEIAPGPNEIGFDNAFIMPATGDRVPTVYVENHRVANLDPADPITVSYREPVGDWPTGRDHPELLRMGLTQGHDGTIINGISRIGFMTGGKAALWVDEDMADTFATKAVAFMEQHREGPFFLYLALHDPHVPRVPHPRYAGRTGMGPRGDAIAQADGTVGQILDALDRMDLADRTLVIFASDNGPVRDDGYADSAVALLGGHRPAGPLRGGKYSIFEGGTRTPFIVRWPTRVRPGVSDALLAHVDMSASLAALVGVPLGDEDAPDSWNVLPALLGTSPDGRPHLVEQAGSLGLRVGTWKYIEPSDGARYDRWTDTELGNDSVPQLYDLATDPGERTNLAERYPERVLEMAAMLQEIRESTRSRR